MNNLNNKIYSNNNNSLLGIVNDLQQIINNTHDNLIIKRIGDIINKMNFIINDNKKNTQLIINHISSLENKIITKLNKEYENIIKIENNNQYIINNNIINENNIINKCKYLYKIYSKMIDNNNNTSKMCKNGRII